MKRFKVYPQSIKASTVAPTYRIDLLEEDESEISNRVSAAGDDIDKVIRDVAAKANSYIELSNHPVDQVDLVEYLEYDAPDSGWMVIQVKLNGDVIFGLEDSEIVNASCGASKKYVKSSEEAYDINELEDVVTDILEEYKFNIGGPVDDKTFEHMINNITFNIEDWGDEGLTEIAQHYEGTEELRDLFLRVCRELEIGFVR